MIDDLSMMKVVSTLKYFGNFTPQIPRTSPIPNQIVVVPQILRYGHFA